MTGISVQVFRGNLDQAINIFKKKLKRSGIMAELKSKSYARSPSEDRRLKRGKAIARLRRQQARERKIR